MSDSAGQITLCQFSEGTSKLFTILQWTGHQYEAWITAFDAWNSAVVYSGEYSDHKLYMPGSLYDICVLFFNNSCTKKLFAFYSQI